MLLPKFLKKDMVAEAVDFVFGAIFSGLDPFPKLKRAYLHVVVLVALMQDDGPDYPNYPNYPVSPHVLYEQSLRAGVQAEEWKHQYDSIAKCKALQLWDGRNDGGCENSSHNLFPGDTPYWGGVNREGIVVACSGVEPYFGMISGRIADLCISLTRHAWETSEDKRLEVDFLT